MFFLVHFYAQKNGISHQIFRRLFEPSCDHTHFYLDQPTSKQLIITCTGDNNSVQKDAAKFDGKWSKIRHLFEPSY